MSEKFFSVIAMAFKPMRWLIGFILHEIAFGLLSVFVPLYIIGGLGGSLIDVGIMAAGANFIAVPFSFFWGYLSDKTRRYRFYILFSFAGLSALLYLFSLTRAVSVLIGLYIVIAVFHVAHEAPKNVLISEYYSRSEWERSFATYEALTEVGWLSGLILGFVLSGLGFSGASLIIFCSFLNLAALVASFLFVKDPLFVFERRLVAIEKVFDFAQRGFSLASKGLDGLQVEENLKSESVSVFCVGLLLFSFATSMLFTPLPVFFSQNLGLAQTAVFVVFMFNTFGGLMGYVLAGKRAELLDTRAVVKKANLMRCFLALILVSAALWVSIFTLSLAVFVLAVMGLVYGFFLIAGLSLSMEIIPEGKAGVFNAIIGLGGALGCFLGTYVAEIAGFPILFLAAGTVFFLSYVAFKIFTK